MASHFQAQDPYALIGLPRPLDPTTGRYVVGDVYGSLPGSRKRKRTELTVGIDGEAVNIYDVSSARLVTSYPVPPQSRFSCPASSIRRRHTESKRSSRYTYVATEDGSSCKISLFKDHIDALGKTESTTKTYSLGSGKPVSYLCRLQINANSKAPNGENADEQLLVVRNDGECLSLDPETLKLNWKTPASVLKSQLRWKSSVAGSTADAMPNFRIEFCIAGLLSDVTRGIFKENNDALTRSPGEDDNSEVLLVVSSNSSDGQPRNLHLHIISAFPLSESSLDSGKGLETLFATPILSPPSSGQSSTFQMDVRSGSLLELCSGNLTVYDLTRSVPTHSKSMELHNVSTMMRISQTSLLAATDEELQVYNPVYRSLQSSTPINSEEQSASGSSFQLVAYFSRLDLAIAIANANLMAVKLETPKTRTKKRRAEGLLIDSIGRGVRSDAPSAPSTVKSTGGSAKSVFSKYLPGSVRGSYLQTLTAEESQADALFKENDITGFESLLASKFGIEVRQQRPSNAETNDAAKKPSSIWKLPKNRNEYPSVDRRWVIFAISRVFHWMNEDSDDVNSSRLVCRLPQSNVLNYLVDAGHLTMSKLKSAFRSEIGDVADSFIAERVIMRLADLDPSLELLTVYISATILEASELVIAVRTVMRSLELVQDSKPQQPKMLTEDSANPEDDSDIGMEIDDLEEEIQKTELYLTDLTGDSGTRGNGLSVAFAKLGNCSSAAMVKALRATFKPQEMLSLIFILQKELERGGWTSRYLGEQDNGVDAPPDGIIKLLADLLCRCIDSIGPGGWILNDAVFGGDEFVATLKEQVSAALEGIEEVALLRTMVGEAVRYSQRADKVPKPASAGLVENGTGAASVKPISLNVRELGDEALPLGLKPVGHDKIEKTKVVSGGEVVQRSARETGHLRSQQVGAYSLERITV